MYKEEFKKWGRNMANEGNNPLFDVNSLGLWPGELRDGLNEYFTIYELPLSANVVYMSSRLAEPKEKGWFNSQEQKAYETKLEKIISDMLDNDIPVIFSIAFKEVMLYKEDKKLSEYDESRNEQLQFEEYKMVNEHFMTITEVITDTVAKRRWLKVQSWGKVYYLDYDEWLDNQGGTYWDAIIQIGWVN